MGFYKPPDRGIENVDVHKVGSAVRGDFWIVVDHGNPNIHLLGADDGIAIRGHAINETLTIINGGRMKGAIWENDICESIRRNNA